MPIQAHKRRMEADKRKCRLADSRSKGQPSGAVFYRQFLFPWLKRRWYITNPISQSVEGGDGFHCQVIAPDKSLRHVMEQQKLVIEA